MSTETSPLGKSAINGVRTALGLSGLVALVVGILILVWPGKTAVVVTAIIAIYAVVGGLVYLGLGIFSKSMGGWARIGHIVLGLIYIVAGIIASPTSRRRRCSSPSSSAYWSASCGSSRASSR
jgi:uncharacterized membrane protein HdeD (DUF308 family)